MWQNRRFSLAICVKLFYTDRVYPLNPICYLKNLKGLTIINVKLIGTLDGFDLNFLSTRTYHVINNFTMSSKLSLKWIEVSRYKFK
jgi:hypothetical protein